MKNILVVAPNFSLRKNERWHLGIRDFSEILGANVIGFTPMRKIYVKDGQLCIFNNSIFVRYLFFIPFLLFSQSKYDYIIINSNIGSRFVNFFYFLAKLRIIDSSKLIHYISSALSSCREKEIRRFLGIVPDIKLVVYSVRQDIDLVPDELKHKFTFVAPGINFLRYRIREELKEGNFCFLFASAPQGAGGFLEESEAKGMGLVFEAFKKFCAKFPANLYLVLRGAHSQRIKNLIKEMGLEGHVHIIDGYADMNLYFNKCWATIFTPKDIKFSFHYPRSLMESLLFGKPVITSKFLEIATIISKENCGIAVEPRVDDIYSAMEELFKNYSLYKENAGTAARKYFDYRTNLTAFLEKIEAKKDALPESAKLFYENIDALLYEEKRWHADSLRERDFRQTKLAIERILTGEKFNLALEIGCGAGTWTQVLTGYSGHLTGLDYSGKFIEAANKKLEDKNVNLILADFQDYALDKKEIFDLIVSTRSIEYMDKKRAVKNLFSLLKPQGKLLIITKNPFIFYRLIDRLFHLLRIKRIPAIHADQISIGRIKKLLKENGFKNIRIFPAVFDMYFGSRRLEMLSRLNIGISGLLWKAFFGKKILFPATLFMESYIAEAEK